MLLINFLSLIANLTFICGDCDLGFPDLDNFDWNKVSFNVLTRFLINQLIKLLLAFIFHLWFH